MATSSVRSGATPYAVRDSRGNVVGYSGSVPAGEGPVYTKQGSQALARRPELERGFNSQPEDIRKAFTGMFGASAASEWAAQHGGRVPKKERKERGGGGGGGGGGPAGEQLPIYNPLYDTILADLNKNNFGPDEQNLFNQRMNQSLDRINLNAETVRRTSAGNLLGTGGFGSGGELTESFKNIGEAQTSDTMTTLDQLAKDEQTYLQGIRDRGIASANQLFNTSLQARTKYNIAKEQAKLAEIMNANALKFAAEQADLNRALEREKLGA